MKKKILLGIMLCVSLFMVMGCSKDEVKDEEKDNTSRAIIEKYLSAYKSGNASKLISCYHKSVISEFYTLYVDHELYDSYEEYLEDNFDEVDFEKFSFEITNSQTLNGSKTEEIADDIENNYDIKASSVKKIDKYTITIKTEDEDGEKDGAVYAVKINSKWYIFNALEGEDDVDDDYEVSLSKSIVEKYMDAYKNRNASVVVSCYHKDYVSKLDEIYEDNGEADSVEESFEDFFAESKDKITSYEITDSKTLSDNKTEEIADDLEENYDIKSSSVKKVVKYTIKIKTEDEDGDIDTDKSSVYAVKIGLKWYIFPYLSE